MLNRQKIIIELLRRAGEPVSRLQLTKWCFLLRHESQSQGGNAFYDFVPYKYGPFSFALYQEVGKLVQRGYIDEPTESMWSLSAQAAREPLRLDKSVDANLASLLAEVRSLSPNGLIDRVYESHPRFTINSEIRKLQSAVKAKKAIFTAGYEGLSIDGFLDMLSVNGVEQIVDVRRNPIARRYGFHKSTLCRLAGNLGISYQHVPDLGIESNLRKDLVDQSDYDRLFDLYEQTTLQSSVNSIQQVADFCLEKASVLVCMEREHCSCHRGRLAPFVARLTGLPVEHLKPAE